MTMQHIDQAADILIAFVFALAIGSAIVNWSVAQHHKRKAAKAQVEYWTKKIDQLERTKPDRKIIAEAVGREMGRRFDRS